MSTSSDIPKPVKLPYFHRTLSEQDSKLIGDIAPKKIEPTSSESCSGGKDVTGSAWNSAKTWEERDCTPWAKETIEEMFVEDYEITEEPFIITFSRVDSISGHASKTFVRGKPRYMYDFSFELAFDVDTIDTPGSKAYSGTIKVSDAANDQLDDIELAVTWKVEPPGPSKSKLNKTLTGKPARQLIRSRLEDFEKTFRER